MMLVLFYQLFACEQIVHKDLCIEVLWLFVGVSRKQQQQNTFWEMWDWMQFIDINFLFNCVRVFVRFIAVSATIPNVEDVAAWLCDEHGPAVSHKYVVIKYFYHI